MNIIFLLAVVVAATQAATPFQWEFDFRQCGHWEHRYQCFAPGKDSLTNVERVDLLKRFDYQTHPHVVAISPQSPIRWSIVMQTRSNTQKVDLDYGMIMDRIPNAGKEDQFLRCYVDRGTVVVTSSTEIQTELVDSYFNKHHLYCDVVVRPKKGLGKNLLDIVFIKDKFALSLKIDGVARRFVDDYKPNGYVHYPERYISSFVHDLDDQKTDCDLSQVEYDPNKALTWGKLREPEYLRDRFFCPDRRYALHVTNSKGQKQDNAKLECKNGYFKATDTFSEFEKFKIEQNEIINVVCYVEDKHLCPISIPCYKEKCPYVAVDIPSTHDMFTKQDRYSPPKYTISCEDYFNDNLVFGEENNRFRLGDMKVNCIEHNLVVSLDEWTRKYKSPHTNATVGYCITKEWPWN